MASAKGWLRISLSFAAQDASMQTNKNENEKTLLFKAIGRTQSTENLFNRRSVGWKPVKTNISIRIVYTEPNTLSGSNQSNLLKFHSTSAVTPQHNIALSSLLSLLYVRPSVPLFFSKSIHGVWKMLNTVCLTHSTWTPPLNRNNNIVKFYSNRFFLFNLLRLHWFSVLPFFGLQMPRLKTLSVRKWCGYWSCGGFVVIFWSVFHQISRLHSFDYFIFYCIVVWSIKFQCSNTQFHKWNSEMAGTQDTGHCGLPMCNRLLLCSNNDK